MIFMALNIVLENYFEDVLSLVDQSSDICDEILDCWFLLFNFFYGLFRLNRLLLLMIFGRYNCDIRAQDMILQTLEKQVMILQTLEKLGYDFVDT